MAALQPLHLLTEKLLLQDVNYTMGDLMRDILKCEKALKDLSGDVALLLLAAVRGRKMTLLEKEQYLAAIYVDPRFNNRKRSLLDTAQKHKALGFLLKTNERIVELVPKETDPIELAKTEVEDESEDSDDSWTWDLIPTNKATNSDPWTAPPTELGLHRRLTMLEDREVPASVDIDVLDYWQKQSTGDPELAVLACVALAVPANLVSVDRTFGSLWPQTVGNERIRHSNDVWANLLYVKLNEEEI